LRENEEREAALALQNTALALSNTALALQNRALALQKRALALHNRALALFNSALALQNRALALNNRALALSISALRDREAAPRTLVSPCPRTKPALEVHRFGGQVRRPGHGLSPQRFTEVHGVETGCRSPKIKCLVPWLLL